jgi:hypothetical protein
MAASHLQNNIHLLTALIAGSAIGTLSAIVSIISHSDEPGKVIRALCDGTFAAGIVLCCAGLFVFVSNEGTFTAIVWGFTHLTYRLKKHSNQEKTQSYFDYVQEQKGEKHPVAYLFITGGIFITLSCIFLIIFELTA